MKYKWRRERGNIKFEQLDISKTEDLLLTHWKMARVVKIAASSEDKVRIVCVKPGNGILKRTVQIGCCCLSMQLERWTRDP